MLLLRECQPLGQPILTVHVLGFMGEINIKSLFTSIGGDVSHSDGEIHSNVTGRALSTQLM